MLIRPAALAARLPLRLDGCISACLQALVRAGLLPSWAGGAREQLLSRQVRTASYPAWRLKTGTGMPGREGVRQPMALERGG